MNFLSMKGRFHALLHVIFTKIPKCQRQIENEPKTFSTQTVEFVKALGEDATIQFLNSLSIALTSRSAFLRTIIGGNFVPCVFAARHSET